MRAVCLVPLALLITSCASSYRPQIVISEERCEALEAWALQGSEIERSANWHWGYPEDVIGLRARMSTCSEEGCEPDEFDIELYEALSVYTHSLGLGEFVWLLAEDCFDANVNLDFAEYEEVISAEAAVRLDGIILEMQFHRTLCVFLELDEDPGYSGCASFRARAAQ